MITPGMILMGKDTVRPQCFEFGGEPYPGAWRSVKHNLNPFELEKELAGSVWTFFYIASAITATAFGFDRAKMIRAALKRLITNVKRQKYNCLEIDDVATRSFL